jgi:hypothetical protein
MGKYEQSDIWGAGLARYKDQSRPVIIDPSIRDLLVPGLVAELGKTHRGCFKPDCSCPVFVGSWGEQSAVTVAYIKFEACGRATMVMPLGEPVEVDVSSDRRFRVLGVFNPRTNLLLRRFGKELK